MSLSREHTIEMLEEVAKLWKRTKDEGILDSGSIARQQWAARVQQCNTRDEARTVLVRMKSGEFSRFAPSWEEFASAVREFRRVTAEESATLEPATPSDGDVPGWLEPWCRGGSPVDLDPLS